MNEQTGTVTMYDTVEEIKNLNRVEGFDPRKFMRTLTGDDGTTKQYLDVVYRKLWFRLKNPDGKIVKKILKLTDQTAIEMCIRDSHGGHQPVTEGEGPLLSGEKLCDQDNPGPRGDLRNGIKALG